VSPHAAPPAPPGPAHQLLADEHQCGWRGTLLRMGRARAVTLITVASLVLSLLITTAFTATIGDWDKLATDLLVAALVPLLVAPAVSGAAMGLLDEVETARRALREVAIRDGLTNLYNRRFFAARLEFEVARARREQAPLTVILIDVDHFKRINDLWGHAAGDAVLQRVADALLAYVQPYEMSARFGGEEFVALLPGASLAEGTVVAERIRAAIEQLRIPALGASATPHVTASLGVATLGGGADNASDLLRRADQAMYDAKASGRNRFTCATRALQAKVDTP
jgi:diguanylate cyclase (GGDEF)-like protein